MSLLDCVRKDDRTSLIFEFIHGRNFIDDLPKFTELNVARYMRELFIALAHVHRCSASRSLASLLVSRAFRFKIIHRDVKPHNFMCAALLVFLC